MGAIVVLSAFQIYGIDTLSGGHLRTTKIQTWVSDHWSMPGMAFGRCCLCHASEKTDLCTSH